MPASLLKLLEEGQLAECEAGLSSVTDLGELMTLAEYLKNHFAIDSRAICETAKKSRALSEQVRRLVGSVFEDGQQADGEQDGPDSDEEDDSEMEGNLLEQVKQNVQRFTHSGSLLEKASTKKRWWTTEEDDKLKALVVEHGARNWKKIASYFDDRSDVQCLHRWQKVLNPKLIKGPWVPNA